MSSKQTKRTSKLHFCPLELEESPHAALKGDFVRYRKEARFVARVLVLEMHRKPKFWKFMFCMPFKLWR